MTQEEKQLLLKDLCARIPYQPLCKKIDTEDDFCESDVPLGYSLRDFVGNKVIIKPYLRPISSMTEEEKDDLCKLCDFEKSYDDRDYFSHYGIEIISEYCVNGEKIVESIINYCVIDFFYEHHLDWRGLIPMGLAIEAPEGMYKIE